MKRILLVVAAIAVVAGAGLYWKYSPLSSAAPKAPGPAAKGGPGPGFGMPVKAGAARTGTIGVEVTAVGTLIANESVMIRPEVAGRVAAIHFSEGQAVAAGARLLTLDAAEVQAQVAGSKADERLNAQRAERAEELYKKAFISQQALDDAREAYKKATAKRQEDEARLAKTEIRAPFAGIIGLRQVSAGAYLQSGAEVARLDKISEMKLDFRVPEVYLGQMGKDQPLTVRVDAFPNDRFSGRVYAVETTVDERTRTAMLRARVPNLGEKLRPGMFARVALELGSNDKAILVPEQAVVPRGNQYFVFRVVDGKAKLTEIEIGSRIPGDVEVRKGLASGELVVTDGQLRIQDGTPVSVLPDKPVVAREVKDSKEKQN
jgi:membrane fusion protein (multidrug efflux system)